MGRVGQLRYLELRSRSAKPRRLQAMADREQQEEPHGADSLPVLQFLQHSRLWHCSNRFDGVLAQ